MVAMGAGSEEARREGLACEGLTKRFPGVVALQDVDLEVGYGEVLCVLGENGAGKSTLSNIISGALQQDAGTMRLDGAPYAPRSPADSIAAGIGMIHQETTLLPELSVAENVLLGRLPQRAGIVDWQELNVQARKLLARVGCRVNPQVPAARLSVAQGRQVEVARALSLDARILILDEPTASLGGEEVETLFRLVRALKEEGVGFIYISHRLSEVAQIGTRVVVLRDGRRVADWGQPEVPVPELVRAMVGRDVEQVYPEPPSVRQAELLRVEHLSRRGAFSDVSFTLRRGEVLGVAGLVGAGRSELARALFGAEPPDGGRIWLDGQPFQPTKPAAAVAAGIVLVPEERKTQGLVLHLPVEENLALPSLQRLAVAGIVRPSAKRKLASKWIKRLAIRGRPQQPAATLSGGNQQKVVIAKWLPRDPKVVIFDEPTRGVDVGARQAIYEVIDELAGQGVGVIVISSDLPEVIGLSHRVLVLSRGQQVGVLERGEADQEKVMALAVGA
jgi:ribose transport system ATP-binding protein